MGIEKDSIARWVSKKGKLRKTNDQRCAGSAHTPHFDLSGSNKVKTNPHPLTQERTSSQTRTKGAKAKGLSSKWKGSLEMKELTQNEKANLKMIRSTRNETVASWNDITRSTLNCDGNLDFKKMVLSFHLLWTGKKAGLILVRKKREKMDDKPLTLEFVEWHKKKCNDV